MVRAPVRILFLGVLATLAMTGVVAPARAQESEAAALFSEARALMLEGRFERACPKLEQSQQLEPRVGTMLNLAVCHERLGMIASAWVEFQQARDAATAEGRNKQRDLAQERIDLLGPRVPWVTLAVAPNAGVDGLALALNGAPVDPTEWGEPMPIDPGEHILVGAAPGYAPREVRFVLVESQRSTVTLAKLERGPRPTPESPTPLPNKSRPNQPKPSRPDPPTPSPQPQGWVLEIGLFGGYLLANGERTSPTNSPSSVIVTEAGTNADRSCEEVGCDYARGPLGGFVAGVNLFGGYAISNTLQVGGKLIVGPRIGGGILFATGPMAYFRVAGPVWLGAGAMAGTASATGRGDVLPASGYYSTDLAEMSASTEFAGGPLLDLGLHVFEADSGALTLSATPFVLFGNGYAFSLPFTVAWRFR